METIQGVSVREGGIPPRQRNYWIIVAIVPGVLQTARIFGCSIVRRLWAGW